jgi:hypothetical protein
MVNIPYIFEYLMNLKIGNRSTTAGHWRKTHPAIVDGMDEAKEMSPLSSGDDRADILMLLANVRGASTV